MPIIQEWKDRKSGQIKHMIILPKEIMDSLAVKKGDRLAFTRLIGNEITFNLERSK